MHSEKDNIPTKLFALLINASLIFLFTVHAAVNVKQPHNVHLADHKQDGCYVF